MSASRHVLSFSDLSPRSFFPPGQRFPTPNHVTSGDDAPSGSGEDVTSGSGVVTPRDFRWMTSGHVILLDQSEATSSRPIRSHHFSYLGAHYYSGHTPGI